MKFSEIKAKYYSVFSRQTEEEKVKNIETIKYCELLAAGTGIDISNWDAHALFAKTGNKFITDRRDINRIFFQESDRWRTENPAPPVENIDSRLTDTIRAQLNRVGASVFSGILSNAQAAKLRHMEQAQYNYDQYLTYLNEAAAHQLLIDRISNNQNALDIAEMVRTIHNGPAWEFVNFRDNELYFVSRNDCVIRMKNPAANIDFTVNLGKFKAVIGVSNSSIKVLRHSGNTTLDGIYHPHVNSNGSICWGNASTSFSQAMTTFNYPAVMGLLNSLLLVYNAGNPYRSLEAFKGAQDRLTRDQPLPPDTSASDSIVNGTVSTSTSTVITTGFAVVPDTDEYDDEEEDN